MIGGVVCIGGPYDGGVIFLETGAMKYPVHMPGRDPDRMCYRRRWFGTSSVLAPDDWDDAKIIARMAKIYEVASTLRRVLDCAT